MVGTGPRATFALAIRSAFATAEGGMLLFRSEPFRKDGSTKLVLLKSRQESSLFSPVEIPPSRRAINHDRSKGLMRSHFSGSIEFPNW